MEELKEELSLQVEEREVKGCENDIDNYMKEDESFVYQCVEEID